MGHIKLLIAGIVVAMVGCGTVATVYAEGGFRSGADVTVPAGETVDSALFAAGSAIDVAGTVNGDVYCAGQTVTISGTVNGDVLCAGQNVTISGNVSGSVRVAGQTVSIEGQVGRDVSAAAQTFVTSASGQTGGDALLAAQSATLNGKVGRDVTAGAANMIIDGVVGRDVTVGARHLALGSTAIVNGNVSYTSTSILTRAAGAHIGGTLTRHVPVHKQQSVSVASVISTGILFGLYWLVALLLIALVFVVFFPVFYRITTETAVRAPWKTLGVGALASILGPAVILGLFMTVIGIPLGLLVLVGWVFVCAVAWTFTPYLLGSLLLHKRTANPIWFMLLGAAILIVLNFVPFIGWLVGLVSLWFGLGMLAYQLPRLPRPRYDVSR